MTDEDLKPLILKKRTLKSQLTKFANFLNTVVADNKINQLAIRIQTARVLLTEFSNILDKIELIDATADQQRERDEFEEKYYEAIAKAEELLAIQATKNATETNPPASSNSNDNTTQNTIVHIQPNPIQLPPINIPKFDGSYENWSSFYSLFKSLVHENPNFPKEAKFYRLTGYLEPNAFKVIESVSSDNYDKAWSMLCERYQNKKLTIKTHVKQLVELSNVIKDSPQSLRDFLDDYKRHIAALKNLGEPVDNWNCLLIHIMTSKLDNITKREWEIKSKDADSPELSDFTKFLEERFQLLSVLDSKCNLNNSNSSNVKHHSTSKAQVHVAVNKQACLNCKGDHSIYFCKTFLELPISARISKIQKLKACLNCLRTGHFAEHCKLGKCRHCNKKHNSLLHIDQVKSDSLEQPQGGNTNTNENNQTNPSETIAAQVTCSISKEFTILSTALVNIIDSSGNPLKCRALLDTGAQNNFMTTELKDKLKLKCKKTRIPVIGINAVESTVDATTKATISSHVGDYEVHVDVSSLRIKDDIMLADPQFNVPPPIDMLLGANIFYHLLLPQQVSCGVDRPILQQSKLGWIISGSLRAKHKRSTICNTVQSIEFHSEENDDILHKQLERFWLIEDHAKKIEKYSIEEQDCETHFCETYRRNKLGKFVVKLPFRENRTSLGESRNMATKRFKSLEKKLSMNNEIKEQYVKFMDEYLTLGHMSPIVTNITERDDGYYLPHHSIIKETSLTTKLRDVFDASAKSSSNLSLNDVLKVGPCIQGSLFEILLRFRCHNVVFTADIAKMYRCIELDESDRKFQQIVWRADPSEPLQHFRLNTVTYGTAPASFLATRCLKQLALDNESKHINESQSISKNFYMDDWLDGAENVQVASDLIFNVDKILKAAGFHLRQWRTNNKAILTKVTQGQDEQHLIKEIEGSKVLGVLWNSKEDVFGFSAETSGKQVQTKREVLSIISQIFDPLGLINPVVVTGKILLQKLWSLKLGWDEPIPHKLVSVCRLFISEIIKLRSVKIPRHLLLCAPAGVEIHCFSDASELAYGACLYVRSENRHGEVQVTLACAKSRVAPLKTITIPRLELCAALLSAELLKEFINSVNIKIDRVFLWCDSTIVLAWIFTQPNLLKTFVSNRVSQIQKLTEGFSWRHVPTKSNPADIISRGFHPNEILECSLWFDGPDWLKLEPNKWPSDHINHAEALHNELALQEAKFSDQGIALTTTNIESHFINRFSSFSKLIRVVSYMLRFIQRTSNKSVQFETHKITLQEIELSKTAVVKIVQGEAFAKEVSRLKKGQRLDRNSKIMNLDPYLDEEGVIRVGGRLGNSKIDQLSKHPIVIPAHHHFTTLVIRDTHYKNLHCGPQTLLSIIRQQYWPLRGKQRVRSVLQKCITCFKAKPASLQQKMADLPKDRVNPMPPFYICGVDYAGPYTIKDSKLRNRKLINAYVCVFVCFVTKAIHVELVSDLSAQGFLGMLRRFVARRGLCARINSDNGTNFLGACNILDASGTEVRDDDVRNFLLENKIDWQFIPARSAHFGGLWESAVRLVKHHLKRILTDIHLSYEDFYTFLTQIESIVNSRPLCPLTEDTEDLQIITPGHFLIGRPLRALPEAPLPEDTKIGYQSKYRQLQFLTEEFWRRWSKDYLNTLQPRGKWKNKEENIKVGALVIMKEDNLPPQLWKLGRVVEIFPGTDGLVRVASVKTTNGLFRRAVTKLCVLPID